MMRSFLVALQFLTRFPITISGTITPQETGRSLLYYPLIGLLIGATLTLIGYSIGHARIEIVTVSILTIWIFICGGLHLDGLADSADAWIGGAGSRDKTLAIMKDPACGPAGVVSIVLILLIKYSSIHVIVSIGSWGGLLLAPLFARTSVIALLAFTPYARQDGIAINFVKFLPKKRNVAACLFLSVLPACYWGITGMLALFLTLFAIFCLRRLMLNRIQGFTGDTLGALIETVEITVLVAFAI